MKKLFTLLAVFTALTLSTQAEVLLKDSFNYAVGGLAFGDYLNMGTDQSKWWYMTGTTDIQVVDTNLVAAGYQSKPAGKAIKMSGVGRRDIRAFNGVSGDGKSVYYSFLLNVDTLKTLTSKTYITALTGTSDASGNNAIYGEVRLTYNAPSSYLIGVSKANETGLRYTSSAIPFDSTVLVVVRYDFVAGEKNDECYIWINPTKLDEGKPSSWCVQDTTNAKGTVQWGANQKVDPSALSICNITASSYLTGIYIDEIRVATKWADLFENGGGGNEPAISVNNSLSFGDLYQGSTVSKDLAITAANLKDNITVTNTNPEISLSASSFTKAAAEAGATLTVTLNAASAGAGVDTIVLTSDALVKKVAVSWTSYAVANCASVAALKDSVAKYEAFAGLFRLVNPVTVTRDVTGSDREMYIQDATGAVKLFDSYGYCDADNLVGANIKDMILNNGEEALGILPFYFVAKPTVVSTGNKVTPEVVTLAQLQANGADYLYELIQINGVTFTKVGETFAVGQYAFNQGVETANLKIESNNIVGTEVPVKANIIGFNFNTSGSVIMPRNADDIIDMNPELLLNGSFEDYKSSSNPLFGAYTQFDDWSTSGLATSALTAETTDVKDGDAALRTSSAITKGYFYQELKCSNYALNDEFKVRVSYKNINDNAISIDCYWESTLSGSAINPAADLKQTLPLSKDAYNTVEIKTNMPEGAKYFFFKIEVAAGSEVLLDDCAFTYVEPTSTAVTTLPAIENTTRKFIYQGRLYIEREGKVYTVTGQVL